MPDLVSRPTPLGRSCSPTSPEPAARLTALRGRLLDWYHRERRHLPWRDVGDPYRVLVSEIMLQQTQVDRVIPKYHAFLERFPTMEALARAPRAEVIRAWAPLGYNRRAVRLHEIAVAVTANGGSLPSDPAELRKLGGLGEYTSAAVACFAFDRQIPTIDTNVRRVLGRIFADRLGDADPTPNALRAVAADAMPQGRARDWNQALMDLGATICTAARPGCERCPVEELCAARPWINQPPAPVRRAAEERVAYRAEPPFANSSRFFRGRIVDRLRALPPGSLIPLDELGRAVRPDYSPRERPWLLGLVRGLEADGLARIDGSETGQGELCVGLP